MSPAAVPGLSAVTPVIITFNEAENIERTLSALSWASSIVVIDSGSTDATLEILARHPAVTVVQRGYDNHASKWNFAIEQVATEWVLTLDADYVLTDAFIAEMAERMAHPAADGYFARFTYCVDGHPLRGTLYPPRCVLFRTARGRHESDGHTQVLRLDGRTAMMRSVILHDDRKPLSRWLEAQERYAILETTKFRDPGSGPLSSRDRLRRSSAMTPLIVFFYCLFVRGLILDGKHGMKYALQRLYAETLLSLHLREP